MQTIIKNVQLYKYFEINSKINPLITILSFWLFLLSIIKARSTGLIYGDLGLFSVLPAEHFVAICFLTISFFLSLLNPEKNKILLLIQILIFIIILTCTPLLLEGTPRFRFCFKLAGEIDYLARNGFLNPQVIRYHNWPSINLLGTFITIVTGISITKILLYTPLVSNIFFLIIVFPLFSRTLSDNSQVWIASWVFILLNWLNQDYFSPQNGAYIIYLTIMLGLFLLMDNKSSSSVRVLNLILAISLVTYHILTPFVLMLNVMALLLITKNTKKVPNVSLIFLFLIIIFFSWQMYGADFMFSKIILSLKNSLYSNDLVSSTQSLMVMGSNDHKIITQLRMNFTFLIIIIAFIGALHLFFIQKKAKLFSILMAAFMCTNLGMVLIGGYGGEILIRVMLFSLLPLSFFIVQNMNAKSLKLILMLFLLISPSIHMITRYGNERIDYTPPTDIQGSYFFFDHVQFNNTVLSLYDTLPLMKYIENYNCISYTHETTRLANTDNSNYIWVTWASTHIGSFLIGDEETGFLNDFVNSLDHSVYYNRIYSNGSFKLYR